MNHFPIRLLVLAGGMAAMLPGCSTLGIGKTEFVCPGMPSGFVCKTPREVYEATNSNDSLKVSQSTAGTGNTAAAGESPFSRPVWKTESGPMPVLEHAQVLRIWIAPWVDARQTLNWPSYVFTEITPRKWSFGGVEFHAQKPLTPMVADFKSGQSTLKEDAPNPTKTSSSPSQMEGSRDFQLPSNP